jgi:prolyl oligopeptidase
MTSRTWIIVPITLALGAAVGCAQSSNPIAYPDTRTEMVIEDLHGVSVTDPYRWLEDLDSAETAAWVKAQNEVTFAFLEAIPARDRIRDRMTELFDYEKYGMPFKQGGRYFYTRNDGLQPQSVLYVAESLDAKPRVLLDPNTLSDEGTTALVGMDISDDGRMMAYALSSAGSDWREIKVRDVDTGKDLDDQLKWIKFSGPSWAKDGAGFYYTRYSEPTDDKLADVNRFPKIYYHKVGTPQSADALIYEQPDEPEWGFNGFVTDDGRYLIISISKGTERENRVAYIDLRSDARAVVDLIDTFDAQYTFIGNNGPLFWFFTNHEAPRGRIIAIDARRPARALWREIIPQHDQDTLRAVSVVGGHFAARYMKDAYTVVRIFDLGGGHVRDVELPGIGTAGGFGGEMDDPETFYSYTSFDHPPTIYRYDMQSGASTLFRKPDVPFNPDDYAVRQVFYRSKDGTRVPMFIVHKKGIALDSNNPTLLYGYGGFNASLTPWFSISRVVWMEMGGVFVLANIRGGGEYGKEWHDAGKLDNKQNCFDDFIAAAEWLQRNGFTRPEKLAISGASNGGTLIGACLTQRPDLFGACLPDVGVMDMLRFHKFTIGWAWVSDYGSPDDPDQFRTLLAYSPYHQLRAGVCYPPTLVTTADHDDRVVPSHSFKFISRLQAAQACDNPVLIRIETQAGHGGGKPTQKIIEEIADTYAFLVRVLGMDANGM